MDGALKLKEVSYIHAEGYPMAKPAMALTPLIGVFACPGDDCRLVIVSIGHFLSL